jgi:hypothetical protein
MDTFRAALSTKLYVRVLVYKGRLDEIPDAPVNLDEASGSVAFLLGANDAPIRPPLEATLGIKPRILKLLYNHDKQTLAIWTPMFISFSGYVSAAYSMTCEDGDDRWFEKPVSWWAKEGCSRIVPVGLDDRVLLYVDATPATELKGQAEAAVLELLQGTCKHNPFIEPRFGRGKKEGPVVITQLAGAPHKLLQDRLKACRVCGKWRDGNRRCGGCKKTYYCSTKCQREDWKRHKRECKERRGAETTSVHPENEGA